MDYLESQRLFKRPIAKSFYAFQPVASTLNVGVLHLPSFEPQPEPERPASTLTLESIAQSRGTAPSERHVHHRAKVNYTAGIRSEAFGDDIVGCIDMSR